MLKRLNKWYIIAGFASLAAILLIAGGIVAGILIGVAPAVAQEPPFAGPPFGVRRGLCRGMGWAGPGAALDTVAEVLDMTPEDLRAELKAGKSLAEVAEEQGVDPQAVCDAMHAQVEERIQEAVADGRLTQEQANQILERMAEREGDCLSGPGRPFGVRHGGGMGVGWRGHGAALDTAAEVLGMTPEDLRVELRAGKSLAEVAEEQSVDPQAVCDAIHGQLEERIQEAVADGQLTQEQADRILERMAEREEDCPSGPRGFFRMRHGGWGRFGTFGGHIPFPQEQ